MNLLFLPIGLAFPTLLGWSLVRLLEGHHPVLLRLERWTLGCALGLTLAMFLAFVVHVTTGAPLVLLTFLLPQAIVAIVLLIILQRRNLLNDHGLVVPRPAGHMHTWLKVLFGLALLWIAAKAIIAATVFLALTPSYLDDTLTNWNLRGRVFYFDQKLTLVMPGESPQVSPMGISSYPPTVPLLKTWLATLAGTWDEGLINSIHVVWYVCALILVFCAVRRYASTAWALFGTYLIGSMPLYLMHGTNAYADAFLSVHVFAAISMVFHAMHAPSETQRMRLLRIAALCAGILPFTKNEGMVIYLPPLLLLLGIALWRLQRNGSMTTRDVRTALLWFAGFLLLIAGPWLAFKWMHGLSFGNGKPITSLGLGWQQNVLLSIAINTFFEGNWLLLFPLLIGLLTWQWRRAFGPLAILTFFFLIIYVGQGVLYLFTSLSTEVLRQTGYARGLIHLTPTIILIVTLLLQERLAPHLPAWARLKE
jgi:hypothetical protein